MFTSYLSTEIQP